MHPSRLKNRLAVIDLGSNTFHLLIVQKQQEPPYFNVLHRERSFLYISSEGIKRIPDIKIAQALNCLHKFRKTIESFGCENISAVGTAALRTASNGAAILQDIKDETGINVRLITGAEEARLIFEGTQCLARRFRNAGLIMDIGGGSVEFVIQSKGGSQIIDYQSHDIGISVLRGQYEFSEPVKADEMEELYSSLELKLDSLLESLNGKQVKTLIGSSGPFEIMESMMGDLPSVSGNVYSRDEFQQIASKVLAANKKERSQLPGMPEDRSDLAKESFLLINFIIQSCEDIEQILVSPFAIKEGLINEHFRRV